MFDISVPRSFQDMGQSFSLAAILWSKWSTEQVISFPSATARPCGKTSNLKWLEKPLKPLFTFAHCCIPFTTFPISPNALEPSSWVMGRNFGRARKISFFLFHERLWCVTLRRPNQHISWPRFGVLFALVFRTIQFLLIADARSRENLSVTVIT